MIVFVDEHRDIHGAGPIGRVLPIALSTDSAHSAIARRIVGWMLLTSMTTSFVQGALNQATCQCRPAQGAELVHRSDRGSQYHSIRHTEPLAAAGIDPSVGRVGDSCHNGQAESIIGLVKTEVVNLLGPQQSTGTLEWHTLEWHTLKWTG